MRRTISISSSQMLGLAVVAVVTVAVAVAGFSVVYAGKIYPGVSLDGMYLGGLSQTAAEREIQSQAAQYASQQLTIHYGKANATIPVNSLGVAYSNKGVMAALNYGRQGSLAQQMRQRIRALLGRPTTFANYSYSDAKLSPTIDAIDAAVNQPVANAAFAVEGDQVAVAPSQPGSRLERGLLVQAIEAQLATMDNRPVTADVYQVAPSITEAALTPVLQRADALAATSLAIQANGTNQTIDPSTILGWVDATTTVAPTDLPLHPLQSFYPAVVAPTIAVTLNPVKVGAYVAQLAAAVDQPAQNATLTWQNGAVSVLQPSKNGMAIDQAKAVQQITAALTDASASHNLTLATSVTTAAVTQNNLSSLGITTLLSDGETTFPGSSAARITNVTVGANKFNGVLLSPGQEFSFGQILGPVGPAQGYLPGLVILGNEETDQYGGGLCQVATTAFRAALLAGLPINERANHSYAVSFYTAPYGVPGVDATIYYPEVDLKFTNDTGHYILIQTAISGDQLDFYFYGTKTKTGVIVPPHFIFGTTNAAQASETQFQRQVLNLSGQVIKTDTFTQYYAPSTDFPIEQTSNGA